MKLNNFRSLNLLSFFRVEQPPVRVFYMADAMGVGLHFTKQLPVDGAVQSSWERADIWVRDESSRQHQRLIVAHELGHLMLHGLGVTYRDTSVLSAAPAHLALEQQANSFAEALLMPRFLLQPLVYAGLPVGEFARIFDVSNSVMASRINALQFGRVDL
jgi:Zn-dependent peptidase ImmA (M78 family)